MAFVFQAAADETESGDQTGPFVFGGWVAPYTDWQEIFAPMWEERVLNGRPTLPYLHVAELLSRKGRAKYGLTRKQAEARIEKAITVIRKCSRLAPAWSYVDGEHFRQTFKETKLIRRGKQPGVFTVEPHYLTFQGFAFAVLSYVHETYPEAETVDFLIEKNGVTTTRMQEEFHSRLPNALRAKNMGHLVRLVGEFIPGDKKRVPLQAADLLLWYVRVFKSSNPTREEEHRYQRLIEGRVGLENTLSPDELVALNERGKAQNVPSPFQPKKKRQAS